MDKNIAYCGLDCLKCPAYQVTVTNNESLRKMIVEEWSKASQTEINLEDINCLGCKSEKIGKHCRKCDIRICNLEQSLENCAGCDFFFGCEKVKGFLEHNPEAKKNLEEIKNRNSAL